MNKFCVSFTVATKTSQSFAFIARSNPSATSYPSMHSHANHFCIHIPVRGKTKTVQTLWLMSHSSPQYFVSPAPVSLHTAPLLTSPIPAIVGATKPAATSISYPPLPPLNSLPLTAHSLLSHSLPVASLCQYLPLNSSPSHSPPPQYPPPHYTRPYHSLQQPLRISTRFLNLILLASPTHLQTPSTLGSSVC